MSALDVSVQAQILNLLEDMKARYGLTLVFIAHDLAVVKNVSDRVAVMYLGKICEVGDPDALYARAGPPVHGAPCWRRSPCPTPTCGPTSADLLTRRPAVAGRPAVGLPVPHPVPAGPGAVRERGAHRSARSAPTSTWPATSP